MCHSTHNICSLNVVEIAREKNLIDFADLCIVDIAREKNWRTAVRETESIQCCTYSAEQCVQC